MSFRSWSLSEHVYQKSESSFLESAFLKIMITSLFIFHLFVSSFSFINVPLGSSIAVADTANICLADAYSKKPICEANDVELTSPDVTIIDGCDYPGDTATIQVLGDFTLNTTERYDVGIWMGIKSDGTASQPGSCIATTLPNSTFTDGDNCGDINNNLTDVNIGTFTVQCIDTDNNGLLDIDYIITRKQPGDNDVCSTVSQAVPGSPAKCNFDEGIDIPVYVPIASADLSLTKTAPTTAFSGDTISYTLTLYNDGPSASTGTITDILPVGFTYVSSSPEATVSDGTLTYSTYLTSGESTTLTINGTVIGASGVVITNTATVASSITDSNLDNNTDDVTTTITATYVPSVVVVSPTANLAITKTVDKSTAYALDNLTYTITYINNGPDTAYDVFIADVIPAGVTIISAPGYTGTGFFVGTLLSGSGSTIIVQVMINDGVIGSILNTASITSTTAGNHPSASVITLVSTQTTSFAGGGSYVPGLYSTVVPGSSTASNPTVSVIEEEPNIIDTPLYEAAVQEKKILTPYKKLPKKMTKSGALVKDQSDDDMVIIEEDLSF